MSTALRPRLSSGARIDPARQAPDAATRASPASAAARDLVVMIVCHQDATNPSGGLEKQARRLSQVLRERGVEVRMLSSTRALSQAGERDNEGVPTRFFWTYHSPALAGRYLPAALIWAAELLVWLVRNRSRIAVIHVHQLRIHALVAALMSALFGIPTIMKSATGGEGADIRAVGSRKYLGKAGRRFLIRHASLFVATTQTIVDDLTAHGTPAAKVVTIPNGADFSGFPKPARPLRRARRCAFLGRLQADKNPVALTKAALAATARLGLDLDIYGAGADEAEVRALIEQARGQDHRVRFVGWVDQTTQVLDQYGWLILPSDAEGLSNAMIEAMAAGVAPVATRVSGCVDHIRDGETGYFLDGPAVPEIIRGLERVSATGDAEWAAMSAAAAAYARGTFSMDRVADAYVGLYEALQGAARRP